MSSNKTNRTIKGPWFHRKPYGVIDRVCIEGAYWKEQLIRWWIGRRSR